MKLEPNGKVMYGEHQSVRCSFSWNYVELFTQKLLAST